MIFQPLFYDHMYQMQDWIFIAYVISFILTFFYHYFFEGQNYQIIAKMIWPFLSSSLFLNSLFMRIFPSVIYPITAILKFENLLKIY